MSTAMADSLVDALQAKYGEAAVLESALSMQRGTLVFSKEAIEVEAELDSFVNAHPGKREAIEDGFLDRVLSGHEIF